MITVLTQIIVPIKKNKGWLSAVRIAAIFRFMAAKEVKRTYIPNCIAKKSVKGIVRSNNIHSVFDVFCLRSYLSEILYKSIRLMLEIKHRIVTIILVNNSTFTLVPL